MTRLIRGAGLVILAAVLAGCGSNAASAAPSGGNYHVSTLTGPDLVVIDVSHVTSGHQPGRAPDGVMPYRRVTS